MFRLWAGTKPNCMSSNFVAYLLSRKCSPEVDHCSLTPAPCFFAHHTCLFLVAVAKVYLRASCLNLHQSKNVYFVLRFDIMFSVEDICRSGVLLRAHEHQYLSHECSKCLSSAENPTPRMAMSLTSPLNFFFLICEENNGFSHWADRSVEALGVAR